MQKTLYRSRENRVLGGVAAGLADYFEIDVAIVRLILLAAALVDGTGALLYLVMWLVIPEADARQQTNQRKSF